MLGILTVRFNHDAQGASSGALNVRKNQSTPALVPEWQAGVCVTCNDSLAAYAGEEVQGKVVSVQAQFAQIGTIFPSAEIRAVAAGPDGSNAALTARPVLGSLDSQTVFFDSTGAAEPITFNAINHCIPEAGVSIQAVHWRWEARLDGSSPWQPFALTHHKIYTLLRTPTAPWAQAPFTDQNDTLPWTDVLEVACTWASGATADAEAIERITRAVNALGGPLFQYDCPGGGASHYVPPATNYFDCGAFLERLRGGLGLGDLINCVDCATIVSTFVNSTGCDLSQARMGMNPPFFACNPIIAIGAADWDTPCGLPGFFFHEVAWSGECGAADQVSDACLQIDSDADPTAAPHVPLVATNERFGNSGDGGYHDRLAAPAGRQACEAQPSMRQRRSVASVATTQIVPLPPNATKALGEMHASALEPSLSQQPAPSRFFWRFFFSGHEIPGWTLVSSSRTQSAPQDASPARLADMNDAGLACLSRTLWAQSQAPQQLLHVDSYECTSQEVARQLVVRLLGEFQLPDITAATANAVGELQFTSAGGAILFAIGNHVHLVRAAGRNRVDIASAAKSIAGHLLAHAEPSSRSGHRVVQAGRAGHAAVMYSMVTAMSPTRWYKFFSASGEFRAQPGRVIFHAAEPGHHDVTVLTVDPFKSAAGATVRVTAS